MVRVVILSVLLAACSVTPGAASPSPTAAPELARPTVAAATATATPAATVAPTTTAVASDDPCEPGPTAGPTAQPQPSPGCGSELTVGAAESSEHGTYLVGPIGHALYVSANDHPGMSMCLASCPEDWPPFVVEEGQDVTGAEGVGGQFATITRGDGSLQVTYDGAPLYHFSGDQVPGDTNGQGIGDVWSLAQP